LMDTLHETTKGGLGYIVNNLKILVQNKLKENPKKY
jgi:hypothetical protein